MSTQRRRSATDDELLAMLRENTGRSCLDSGDAYGRHWQQNQERDLESEASTTLSFRYGGIEVAHRLYGWLRERLELDAEANDAFQGPFLSEIDPDDGKSWGELREAFPEWFAKWKSLEDSREPCPSCEEHEDQGCDDCGDVGSVADDSLYSATGIYGEGEPATVNSYNEENLLAQTILFTYFELRSGQGRSGRVESYVILQLHGGCDVRGGYTRPRVFRIDDDDDELAIFDFRRGTIYCETDSDHWWATDDGYHWYREGSCGRGAGTQLEAYARLEIVDTDEETSEKTTHAWIEGSLCVTARGDGRCPVCGGCLRASAR